ncbi:MAG: radical SAM protein [Treponema sp.]|jgi:hypothetical protein|nr:radical SAM protein [Treponema sp.]
MKNAPFREIILVQPPFVQLNSPYPSPYYLKSFLEKRGCTVQALDHSIGLFEKIFCHKGLELIFSAAEKNERAKSANRQIKYNIDRFLSEQKLWLASIDRLVNFLRGRDDEWGHFLALANGSLPSGPRFDACLEQWDGEVSPDSAKLLATKLLSDLADFINAALDPGFSLIRYTPFAAEAGAGLKDFDTIEKSLSNFIMESFYRPMLEEEWARLKMELPFVLGITIPFPGCLAGALVCAASAKKHFGEEAFCIAGGGYVNTELRFTMEKKILNYFDSLSFDRGYSFLDSILGNNTGNINIENKKIIDDEAAKTVFPDYSGVDFSRYLLPVDDANPMHRLWSGGRWLKAYLAHGCYWHSCTFCDVSLDYIRNYIPVDTESFFLHFKAQAEETGIRGLHLVDEAAPPASLLRLALLNREVGLPLNFWGNIRFEKSFTPDAAAVLASGGLIGVSAGIEIAAVPALKRLGKGISLDEIVSACAAFKEAGILVHAYLIYGYWDQDEQEIIDSAEIIRQFFAEGLLDSCFWHKFILTRHSRVYAEKQRGLHKGLEISGDDNEPDRFALNDLSFKGEKNFDKYSEPLDRLASFLMSGNTETPVTEVFPFKVRKPNVPCDQILNSLNNYALLRDSERERLPDPQTGRLLFLGSMPIQKGRSLFWRRHFADCSLKTAQASEAEKTAALINKASIGNGIQAEEFYGELKNILGEAAAPPAWRVLRHGGALAELFVD